MFFYFYALMYTHIKGLSVLIFIVIIFVTKATFCSLYSNKFFNIVMAYLYCINCFEKLLLLSDALCHLHFLASSLRFDRYLT